MNGLPAGADVNTLFCLGSDLYVGGNFNGGGIEYVARWLGTW